MLATPNTSRRSSYHLETKVDVVCGLLAMLGGQEHSDVGESLLALSSNPESCLALRQSGCMPLLVQLIQSDKDGETRNKAARAVCNLIGAQPDERIRKREGKVFRLLEEMRGHTEELKRNAAVKGDSRHPLEALVHLMKLSFDEDHRQVICHFGGIHVLASLIEAEHVHHGGTSEAPACVSLRKYVCMTLTNVTFGDGGNKALLCSYRKFMRGVVVQLRSSSEELMQVSATILRNLSWHADATSRDVLREVGAVAGLIKAAMAAVEQSTLKCILSALWNLSAHSAENKAEICAIDGALGFLVNLLLYGDPAIVENSGGVLRNVSSQVAVRDDYREILRKHNCLRVLIEHLKSTNLTIVNNACGIVWNLSAKCVVDQDALIQSGALDLLSSLTTFKHKMIALSASAALRNLVNSAQKRAAASGISAVIIHKHQDFIVNNIDASTICDESLYFENIYEYIPMSDLKRKIDTQKQAENKKEEELNLCQSFSGLNLTSTKPKYLPPAPKSVTSSPSTYIPVRNKFSDCAFDDEIGTSEQPIDYSRKYAEVKINPPQVEKMPKPFTYGVPKDEPVKEEKSFGIYTETDLDQPTDYSLQFAEDDSDSDCDKIKTEPGEFSEDTVKTYCTEGTPYETPFNFSTATSMSDLRVDANKTKETVEHDAVDSPRVELKGEQAERKIDVKSQFSSGLISPDKPINYCEEGTPGYFSRVSSFGSLVSMAADNKEKLEEAPVVMPGTSAIKGSNKANGSPAEVKVVKFEQVLNYAEETPLMFSRSSSLASLDSIEQHSIHDDRSSVVSDFSRRTSGIVSPSELPDSPSQTIPPSPRTRKTVEFAVRTAGDGKSFPSNHKILPKSTVFEDKVTKFKEESTPLHFSCATSLSSLMIDDESGQNTTEQVSNEKIEESAVENENERKDFEEDDENDEEILAACIKMGILSKRVQKQEPIQIYESKNTDENSDLSEDDNKILAECIQDGILKTRSSASCASAFTNSTVKPYKEKEKKDGKESCKSVEFATDSDDKLTNFKEESTPLHFSCATSLSSLMIDEPNEKNKENVVKITEEKPKNDLEEDNENDEEILAACIKLGILSKRVQKQELKTYDTKNKIETTDKTSDVSGSLSEDDNKILAECIQDGILKARSSASCTFACSHKEREKKNSKEKNGPALRGCCSHTGLNSGGDGAKQNYSVKSSLSDCSDDRLIGWQKRRKAPLLLKGNHSDDERNGTSRAIKLPERSPQPKHNSLKSPTNKEKKLHTKLKTQVTSNKPILPQKDDCCTSKSSFPCRKPPATNIPVLNKSFAQQISAVDDPRLIHPALERVQAERIDKRHKDKPIFKFKKPKQGLQKKVCMSLMAPSKDEVQKYAVENSPSYVSLRSSLSDLTVDGSGVITPHPEEPKVNDEAAKCLPGNDRNKCGSNDVLVSDEDDDAILAACIQMGIRGISLRGQSKLESPKKEKTEIKTDDPPNLEPLVGRLETGTPSKLSFRLKNKSSNESGKCVNNVESETNPLPQPAIESTDAISAQDSFSSFSIESVSLTESEQTVVEPPIKECEAQKEAMPSCSSRPTKSDKRKSKKALVAKMGRVVDLLKLRKN